MLTMYIYLYVIYLYVGVGDLYVGCVDRYYSNTAVQLCRRLLQV